jgi:hypothetical protein
LPTANIASAILSRKKIERFRSTGGPHLLFATPTNISFEIVSAQVPPPNPL